MARKSTRVNSGLGGRPNRDVRHKSGMIETTKPTQIAEIADDIDDEEEDDVLASVVSTLKDHKDSISKWLKKVGDEEPLKALTIYIQLLEYHTPKKQRVDGKNDKDNQSQIVMEGTSEFEKRKAEKEQKKLSQYGNDFP